MIPQYAPEESLCCRPVPPGLEVYIEDLAILIYGSPQIMLPAFDPHEDFIDV
jgi:hypothetical protein